MTGNNGVPSGVHTVNEREYKPLFELRTTQLTVILVDILVDDFVEMIRFFITFILNADENEL